MALSSKVGNLNITTGAAGGTVVVTGLGFQPKVLILWWNGLTATNTGTRQTSKRGMGFAVSASSFCAQAIYDEDAAGTAVTKNNVSAAACVIEVDNTGAVVGGADLQSFDADGFTLEITDAFPTDLLVSYVAYGGSDITDAEIGSFTPSGVAPVNQTVNNSGNFQPDITLFMFGAQIGAGVDAFTMFGAATGSSNEAVLFGGSNDAAATAAAASYCLAGECLAWHVTNPTNSPTNRAEFVSHNTGPGGFTINWLERTNTTTIKYLSIKGGEWMVGDVVTATSLTTVTETGLGFEPAGLMVISAGKVADTADATGSAHDKWSVGAADSASSRVVQQVDSRNSNTTMFVHPSARTDAIMVNTDPPNTSHTLQALMDVQSFDSDGFTLVMDDADAVNAFAWYIAAGNIPGTSVPGAMMLMGVGG